MKKLWCKILLATALLASASVVSQAKGWESVRHDRMNEARIVKRTTEVEIRSERGTIYVYTSKAATVRVFSILGQLVSQETIPAGVSALNLNMHGVFIVKIGDTTCKVAL